MKNYSGRTILGYDIIIHNGWSVIEEPTRFTIGQYGSQIGHIIDARLRTQGYDSGMIHDWNSVPHL